MKTKILTMLIFLLFTCFFNLHAQNAAYTIHGEVIFKGEGTMYIFLVDKELFDSEVEGLKKAGGLKEIEIKLTQQDILNS